MAILQPIFKKAYWSLAAAGGLYALFCIAIMNPTVQKHALYMHKVNSLVIHDVNDPEIWGFARHQVTPFNVTTADKETLYCWHVLPQEIYALEEQELLQAPVGPRDDFKSTMAYTLLKRDPEARVVVNLHGNAGHVAQGYRPQTYRALTQSSPHVHVLTFDYRGFGHSTGDPSEVGLLLDALSFITYVIKDLGIPPERITLLGQSLGTAVASATTLHFADQEGSIQLLSADVQRDEQTLAVLRSFPNNIDFAATIIVASFPSLKQLLMTYRLGGLIPVLSPLRFQPKLVAIMQRMIVDHWPTAERLAALAPVYTSECVGAEGRNLNLHIMHAVDDADIPWRNGLANYEETVTAFSAAAREMGVQIEAKDAPLDRHGFKHTLSIGDSVRVKLEAVKFGGHNQIMAGIPVALAVLRAFRLP